jgi:hypothetical protein
MIASWLAFGELSFLVDTWLILAEYELLGLLERVTVSDWPFSQFKNHL